MGNTASNIAPPATTLPTEMLISNTLANAGLPIDKINQTIDMVNQNIMCGPECQKQKEIDDLKTKYNQAEDNLTQAPNKYQLAKKNYYVALDGPLAYQEKQKLEFQKEAQDFINNEKKQRDNQTKEVNNLIKDYQALIIYSQNMNDLLDVYITKNQRLKREIDTYDTVVKTSERKTYYKTQSLEWYESLKKLIIYFYFLSLIVYVLYVIIYHREFTSKRSLFILFLLIIIPYIVYKVYVQNIVGNSIADVVNYKNPRYEFKIVKEKNDN